MAHLYLLDRDEKEGYVVDTTIMDTIEPLDGYQCIGMKAYFKL